MKYTLATLLVIFLALATAKKAPGLVYQGSDGQDKLASLSIRSITFVGGSAWVETPGTGVTDNEKQVTWQYVNISKSPADTFVTTDVDTVKKYPVDAANGADKSVYHYYIVETKATWNVLKPDATTGEVAGWGNDFADTTTLNNQRSKFRVCSYYKNSQSDVTPTPTKFKYKHNGCTTIDIGENNKNKHYENYTVTIVGFGDFRIWFTYQHVSMTKIPKYVTSIKVNKIRAFTYPQTNQVIYKETWPFAIQAFTNQPFQTYSGSGSFGTGFTVNIGGNGVVSGGFSTISFDLKYQRTYDATGQTGVKKWISAGSGNLLYKSSSISTNIIDYCGTTTQVMKGMWEAELEISCSSGNVLKFAFGMLMMAAGLLLA